MTSPISETERAIRFALSSGRAEDIISGVKDAVSREISTLSPDVSINYTNYYNHTYMPDIMLTWGRGTKEVSRPLFIRNALRASSTVRDVTSLESTAPVVLGLKRQDENEELAPVRDRARQSERVLITDVRSLSQVHDVAVRGSGGSPAPEGKQVGPLMRIVQGNLLQSGRGLFTDHDAETLVTAAREIETTTPQESESAFEAFRSTANELFAPDGVRQLVRAGRLLQSGVSRAALTEFIEMSGGALSETDLRIILPYLLGRSDSTDDPQFWGLVGSMVDLSTLEQLPEIYGLDLTRLVSPSLERWTAKKAELVINNEYEDETIGSVSGHETGSNPISSGDEEGEFEHDATSWSIVGGRLTGLVGRWKLVLAATDARRISGRDGEGIAADWSELSQEASKFILDAISLRGVTRRIMVSAEESGSVAADIIRISESIEDSFRVTEADVRIPGSEYEESVHVEFAKMTATARRGVVPVSELGTIALSLLGYRYPTSYVWSSLR